MGVATELELWEAITLFDAWSLNFFFLIEVDFCGDRPCELRMQEILIIFATEVDVGGCNRL